MPPRRNDALLSKMAGSGPLTQGDPMRSLRVLDDTPRVAAGFAGKNMNALD
jgi:hypothetical protein